MGRGRVFGARACGRSGGRAADAGVHLGATERFVVALLAGRHLDEGWSTEEHLGPLVDHHDVVAHARDVGAAGSRVPEHEGHRGDAEARHLGDVVEGAAAGDEDLGLRGKVRAAGLDEIDEGQTVLLRDLHRAQVLPQGDRVDRTATRGRVVRDDYALPSLDDADPGDHARPDGERRAPPCERRQLEERRVAVDEELDPLPGEQLAALSVPVHVLLATANEQLREQRVVLLDQTEER